MRTILILFVTLVAMIKAQADALDTWTNVATSPWGDFTQIAFGNGQFMAVSTRVNHPAFSIVTGTSTSGDGLHWTSSGVSTQYPNSEEEIGGVAFGNGTFAESVSFGDGGAIYWTQGTNGGQDYAVSQQNCVAFGNGFFVSAGFDYEGGDYGNAYLSTNGQTWSSEIEIAANFFPTAIAFGNGAFVATGFFSTGGGPGPNRMFYSTDGRHWTDESPYVGTNFSGISFVNGLFATTGPGGTNYTCPNPDIYDFTAAGTNNPALYVPTSGANHLYVGVGSAGAVFTSTNRTNWISRTTGITNNLTCLAYGDNRFVAAGSAGQIFVSGSTIPVLAVQNQLPSGTQLSLTGGLGPTYHIQASTDLSAWTNLAVFTNIGAGITYLDTNAGNFTLRYYRSVSP